MDSFFHSITTLRHSSSKIIRYVLRVSTMASAQLINCIVCDEPVRPRQQGVQCDGCLRWNHRLCNTGISQEAYRTAVTDGVEIDWLCAACAELTSEQEYDSVAVPDSPPPSSPIPASPTPVSPTAPSPTSSPLPVSPTAASPVDIACGDCPAAEPAYIHYH